LLNCVRTAGDSPIPQAYSGIDLTENTSQDLTAIASDSYHIKE